MKREQLITRLRDLSNATDRAYRTARNLHAEAASTGFGSYAIDSDIVGDISRDLDSLILDLDRPEPKPEVVGEIVRAYLKRNGFDGLYCDHWGCGCEVDDLAPCDSDFSQCKPGHKIPCDPETCEAEGNCDWHIGPREVSP